ncbi:MAG: ATP-binding protein [Dehalococcoidia bacterium]
MMDRRTAPGGYDVAYREQGVESYWPQAPDSVRDTGLSAEFLSELTLKTLFISGPATAEELGDRLGISYSLCEELTFALKTEQSIEAMGSSGYSDWGIRYRLTGKGGKLAEAALDRSRYVGAVPVTLPEYTEMARFQSLRRNPPTQDMLGQTFEPFILRPDVKDSLSRIFFSGRTVLIFGESGNGKTSIVESYAKTFSGSVLFPQALYVAGQIIRVYDPAKHVLQLVNEPIPVEGGPISLLRGGGRATKFDRRWIKIRRPVIFVGGELEPHDLDLTFDETSRLYQAPAHMKAQDGIFMIDDFGRQRARPEEILNRWIVPMESSIDNLTLQTGESFTIPFEIALIFSSNLKPNQLADEAFLRRIPYKINLPTPDPVLFAQITRMWCGRMGVAYSEDGVDYLTRKLFDNPEILPRATHPRDIAQMILDYARYDGLEPALTPDYVDKACTVYFIVET